LCIERWYEDLEFSGGADDCEALDASTLAAKSSCIAAAVVAIYMNWLLQLIERAAEELETGCWQ